MPETDDIKPDSKGKPYPKSYLRHHSVISLLKRQLEGDQSTLPVHPHALTAIAEMCEVLAAEARAEGDEIHDARQSAEYYTHADACDSVASQLYLLVTRITVNNDTHADYPIPAKDHAG